MSTAGRPKVLDEDKQATVCSLVAAGVSLRQAAHFVECDPGSIRREAQRNDEFRRQLAKAKSEASMHPLQTLHQAAKDDWRAALRWLERMDPERFARPNAHIVTQREANQFVAHLLESVERAVPDPRQRKDLYEFLTAAMPAAMQKRWQISRARRKTQQAMHDCEQTKIALEEKLREEAAQLERRRREIFAEIKEYLPTELRKKLALNTDVLVPHPLFAQRLGTAAQRACAPVEPHNDAPTTCSPTNDGPPQVVLANNASPSVDFASPRGEIV